MPPLHASLELTLGNDSIVKQLSAIYFCASNTATTRTSHSSQRQWLVPGMSISKMVLVLLQEVSQAQSVFYHGHFVTENNVCKLLRFGLNHHLRLGGQFNDSAIHFIGRLAKKWQAGKTRREKAGVFFVGSSRVTTNGVTRSFAALFRFAHIGTMLRGWPREPEL